MMQSGTTSMWRSLGRTHPSSDHYADGSKSDSVTYQEEKALARSTSNLALEIMLKLCSLGLPLISLATEYRFSVASSWWRADCGARVAVVGILYIPASPLPAVVAHYGARSRWRPWVMAAAVSGRVRWSPENWGRGGTRDVRRVPVLLIRDESGAELFNFFVEK
jgi:hypothetical protein